MTPGVTNHIVAVIYDNRLYGAKATKCPPLAVGRRTFSVASLDGAKLIFDLNKSDAMELTNLPHVPTDSRVSNQRIFRGMNHETPCGQCVRQSTSSRLPANLPRAERGFDASDSRAAGSI